MDNEIFLCDDERGNGCGRLFDGAIVKKVKGLCEICASDMPDENTNV